MASKLFLKDGNASYFSGKGRVTEGGVKERVLRISQSRLWLT